MSAPHVRVRSTTTYLTITPLRLYFGLLTPSLSRGRLSVCLRVGVIRRHLEFFLSRSVVFFSVLAMRELVLQSLFFFVQSPKASLQSNIHRDMDDLYRLPIQTPRPMSQHIVSTPNT